MQRPEDPIAPENDAQLPNPAPGAELSPEAEPEAEPSGRSAPVPGRLPVPSLVPRGRPPTSYTTPLMMKIVERVANGETLTAVCKEPGMPIPSTFRAWIVRNPELRKAWEAAKELRAHAMFDQALDVTKRLLDGNWGKEDAAMVRALDAAIQTLKWAAGRLSPRDYGERQPGNPVVPIQINTTLELGQGGTAVGRVEGSVYTIKATIPAVEASGQNPSGTAADGGGGGRPEGRSDG